MPKEASPYEIVRLHPPFREVVEVDPMLESIRKTALAFALGDLTRQEFALKLSA